MNALTLDQAKKNVDDAKVELEEKKKILALLTLEIKTTQQDENINGENKKT